MVIRVSGIDKDKKLIHIFTYLELIHFLLLKEDR